MEFIKWSKEQLKSVIDTENKRLRELDAQLIQISIDKENRAKQVLAKSLEKKETLTKEILKLGLWDSKQLVTKKMKRLKTKKEKQNALKSQINFRHFVLEQKAEKRLFQTNKYQKKVVTIDQLQSNLIYYLLKWPNKTKVNMQILLHFNKYI
jgi:alkyl hydroperoxide reductase subunit AhpC